MKTNYKKKDKGHNQKGYENLLYKTDGHDYLGEKRDPELEKILFRPFRISSKS